MLKIYFGRPTGDSDVLLAIWSSAIDVTAWKFLHTAKSNAN